MFLNLNTIMKVKSNYFTQPVRENNLYDFLNLLITLYP